MDRKKWQRKLKGKSKAKGITPGSEDDAEFLGSSSEGSSSSDEGDESDEIQISNKEVIPTLSTVYGRLIFFTACRLTSIENHSCQQETIIESEWQKETMPKKCPRQMVVDTADEDVPVAPSTAKPTVPKKVL